MPNPGDPLPWQKCRKCGVKQPVAGRMNELVVKPAVEVPGAKPTPSEYECIAIATCRTWGRDGVAFDTGVKPMLKPMYTPETNPAKVDVVPEKN